MDPLLRRDKTQNMMLLIRPYETRNVPVLHGLQVVYRDAAFAFQNTGILIQYRLVYHWVTV